MPTETIEKVRVQWPIANVAFVLLPDHLHTIWTLPETDADYSVRWKRIKQEFTEVYLANGGQEGNCTASRQQRQERGVWQRRFWDHMLRNEDDLEQHFDYIHYNPVKHGYVTRPCDWPYSSFHRYVKMGFYPPDWGCASQGPLKFNNLDETAME